MSKLVIFSAHPAHVHQFKNVGLDLLRKGWDVFFIATPKDASLQLIQSYGFKYYALHGTEKKGWVNRISSFVNNSILTYRIIATEKPQMALSRLTPFGSFPLFFKRIPHLCFSDTETAGIYDWIFSKLCTVLLTSTTFRRQLKKDQIRIKSNKELTYLHPAVFIPNKVILEDCGIKEGTRYAVVRYVSMKAYHDIGKKALSGEMRSRIIDEISRKMKVIISIENKRMIDNSTGEEMNISPSEIHHLLYYADLFVGESSTMAVESAVLGTPAVYINDSQFGYTDEMKDYGLLFPFISQEEEAAFEKIIELLSLRKIDFEVMKRNFVKSKVNFSAFWVWFIEKYPESYRIMKNNPEYQDNF